MNTLVVIPGPTGVGKTALTVSVAKQLNVPIISADSRQLYKALRIGTAAPEPYLLATIKHYMVGTLELTDYYSASQYEEDVLALLTKLFEVHTTLLLTGGSMLYIDAICKGIDQMPTVSPAVREALWVQYQNEGLAGILDELKQKDPQHYNEVDRANYKRVIHAVEMCRMTNQPYSSFRTRTVKKRPFQILKVGLNRPREELYDRINNRVYQMLDAGWIEEAKQVFPYRHLNALNTVGYKELFQYFDGDLTLEGAIEKIQRNTRVYARKQITWFKKDPETSWFHPNDQTNMLAYIEKNICSCQ